jgi:hypothetical protein
VLMWLGLHLCCFLDLVYLAVFGFEEYCFLNIRYHLFSFLGILFSNVGWVSFAMVLSSLSFLQQFFDQNVSFISCMFLPKNPNNPEKFFSSKFLLSL